MCSSRKILLQSQRSFHTWGKSKPLVRCAHTALIEAWSQQSIANTWQRIEPMQSSENLIKKGVLLQVTEENL